MVVGELKAQYKRYISIDELDTLNCSNLVFEVTKKIPELQEDIEYKEHFYIFMLNNASKLTGFSKIGEEIDIEIRGKYSKAIVRNRKFLER